MLKAIKKALGLKSEQRKKATLPAGLQTLEAVPAKAWWN